MNCLKMLPIMSKVSGGDSDRDSALEAAEALLELYAAPRISPPGGVAFRKLNGSLSESYGVASTSTNVSSRQTLVVTSVTSSPKAPIDTTSDAEVIKLPSGGYIIRNNKSAVKNSHIEPEKKQICPNLHEKYRQEQKAWTEELQHKLTNTITIRTEKEKREREKKIYELEASINDIRGKLDNLNENVCEMNMRIPKQSSSSEKDKNTDDPDNSVHQENNNSRRARIKSVRQVKSNSGSDTPSPADSGSDSEYKIEEDDGNKTDENSFSEEDEKAVKVRRTNTGSEEMIRLRQSKAFIPARLLKQIDWSSHTQATRKLMAAVFPRKVLASHSLSGKPSPAFPDKPAKKKLDPDLVVAIVQMVVDRCSVKESVVRTSITTKCADESKMYRSRQMKNEKLRLTRKENVPPSSDSEA